MASGIRSLNQNCSAIMGLYRRHPPWMARVGEWLSLVEHLVRDQGVGGSNPLSPTNQTQKKSLTTQRVRSFGFAQDFACGLPLGFASLTPAKRLKFKSSRPDNFQSAHNFKDLPAYPFRT